MSAVMKEPTVRVAAGPASEREWRDCAPGTQVKVLAVDVTRNSVEYLARVEAGNSVGPHRHRCESYIYVLDGSVINRTTGCEFSAGDFCHQPDGDEHEEIAGPNGAVTYVSLRGHGDTLLEYFDEHGGIRQRLTVSDFASLLQ